MKSHRITLSLPSLLVMLALAGVIAFQAAAHRATLASPTVVVTVNRSRVLDNLKERAEDQAKLEQMRAGFQAEAEKRRLDVQSLGQQLEKARTGGAPAAELERLQGGFDRARLDLDNYAQMAANRFDLEVSLLYVKLYQSIASAIGQMAEAEGFDIVLVHDGEQDFQPPDPNVRISRENQIKQQIATRRVMYARSAVDITDQIILRMNNAFDAGAARPAASGRP